MSKSEEKIENVFFELIDTYPIEEINISLLTSKLKMSRQSFYYHYQSIYDLIFSIFYSRKIICNNYNDFKEIICDLQAFLNNYKVLCKKIINSNASDILEEFIYSYLLKSLKEYFRLKNLKNDYLITFYASGIKDIVINVLKQEEDIQNLVNIIAKTFLNGLHFDYFINDLKQNS